MIQNLKDFEPVHIFECGQCFRWKREADGSYIGVFGRNILTVKKQENVVLFKGITQDGILKTCMNYFDLERDYSNIKKQLCEKDEMMRIASGYGEGIRILRQEPWEMLISFILSAANNIPRISKIIENIAKEYGDSILYNQKEYHFFPTPEQLAKASIEDLRRLNLGFRDKYVYEATKMVLNGEINLEHVAMLELKDAKNELMRIPGVGAKVADCILLFSMNKLEAFPIDTWVKKVMAELYTNQDTKVKVISQYAAQNFGQYAGIAQQYLFYYRRENEIAN